MYHNTIRVGLSGRSIRGHTVLAISGELDIATTAVLRDRIAAVLDDRAVPVIIDLSRVSFCDASGLRMLVAVRHRADAHGCVVALAGPRPNVRRLLRITGLDQIFPIYSTVGQAVPGRPGARGPAVA
jgi:anti-sigma B factor antagonist